MTKIAMDPSLFLEQTVQALQLIDQAAIRAVSDTLFRTWERAATIFLAGNGGSAACASHFAADLSKMILPSIESRGLRAICLSDNIPALTAWSNDLSYATAFSYQLKTLAIPGDVVLVISGSGNSPNILDCVQKGNEWGMLTIGFTGFDGGQLAKIAQQSIVVPSNDMGIIEGVHSVITHAITRTLKEAIADER